MGRFISRTGTDACRSAPPVCLEVVGARGVCEGASLASSYWPFLSGARAAARPTAATSNLTQIVKWSKVAAAAGVAGIHIHDLRHAGNLWASESGMSTKDLMARMGHDDMRAALIYQRATDDAERRIAEDSSRMATDYREGRAGA